MNNVLIEIESRQDGKEISYIYTKGIMKNTSDQGLSLEFDGTGLFGESNGHFRVSVPDKDKIIMSVGRGKKASSIVFEGGIRSVCHFNAEGDLSIVGVNAKRVMSNVGKNGGEIQLKYVIDFNCLPPVTNEMKIRVKKEADDITGLDMYFEKDGHRVS